MRAKPAWRPAGRWLGPVAMALAGHGIAAALLLAPHVPDGPAPPDTVEIVFTAATEPATPVPGPAAPAQSTPEPPAPEPAPELALPAPPLPPPPALPRLAVPARPRPPLPRPASPTAGASPGARESASAPSALAPLGPAQALAAPAPAPRTGIDPAWRSSLSAWLAARKRYPPLAQEREIEGTVGVTFTVERDGRVASASITRPSGSALLDDAVLVMLAGQRVPPFPPDMAAERTSITVPIRYSLDR